MDEKSQAKPEDSKPFSILAQFRQLKKEKEQTVSPEEKHNNQATTGTVFQVATSAPNQPNGDCSRRRDFRSFNNRHDAKRRFENDSTESPRKRHASDMHEGQKEKDVGITEYIRDGPGFDVILKHRYTDFQVNEIDKEGNVIKLTSTEFPEDDVETGTLSQEEDPTILTPEQWAALNDIVEKQLDTTVDVDVTDFDKGKRQSIHKAAKKRFGIHIFSNTADVDGRKITKIGFATSKTNSRFVLWPKERPEYLHFSLYKECTEMSEAVNVISRLTFIKASKFGFAGNKDKRAVTTQQVSVRRGDVKRFTRCQNMRNIVLGNWSYKWKGLRLGDLKGNRFKIALRNVKASDEVIQNAVEKFKQTGFINYYGMQRFGQSLLVPTYKVGMAILNRDWKLATELILKPRPGESCHHDVKEARDIWWETRDAAAALKPLTRKDRSIEGKILSGLKKHGPNAYQNSFDNLTKQTVTLYLYSYQSLIWNKVVSRRIQQHGLKVLPGDLVKVVAEAGDKVGEDLSECKEEEEEEGEDDVSEEDEGRIQVRPLSAEEAETASIYDVVYPMPGVDVRLPDNEVAQWYSQLMEADGLSLAAFDNVPEKYGSYGSYRHILERAEDLVWSTTRYSSLEQDLLQTDLSALRSRPPPDLDPEGPFKALIIEFNLKACSFATMAVRELTKSETSTSNQAKLTQQARDEEEAKQLKKGEVESSKTETTTSETTVKSDNRTMDCEMIQDDKTCTNKTESKETVNADDNSCRENENNMECEENMQQALNIEEEERELNKREAEADNIINKYLEQNYH